MASTLMAVGASAADVPNANPLPRGIGGAPLGAAGDGAPGKAGLLHCEQPAGRGQPGNDGGTGPAGSPGGNGDSVYALKLYCAEYSGGMLTLLNHGGNGGRGGDGGPGGSGSAGGNAGKQPKHCRDVIAGGRGGSGGQGGRAGTGGDAGSAGDVKVLLGSALGAPPVNVDSASGQAGLQGTPGGAGTPGHGGRNSDGSHAADGVDNGGGPPASAGKAGYGGSVSVATDPKAAPRSLTISIVPRRHG